MEYKHVPVMLKEVLYHLNVKPGGNYIDCTLGGAGYTVAIAKAVGKKGKVLALDMDPVAIKNAKNKIKEEKLENIVLVRSNFKNIEKVAAKHFKKKHDISGIVFDLGLSSFQLADTKRGFSFQHDAPLDMAFGKQSEKFTEDIVNRYKIEDLTKIFREYGEDKYAYKIAKAIILKRKEGRILNTLKLAELIKEQYPKRSHYRIHPATKVFQALRMETNQELDNLRMALPLVAKLLKYKGRLVTVSFHSGEDRIVKLFLKESEQLMAITKKPLLPSLEEQSRNPRSRSAKLRSAIKVEEDK